MRAEIEVLRSTILRVELLAAGMACSPKERLRLLLLAHEDPAGITTANMRELQVHVLEITRDAAVYAQAAVSLAAAAPDEPRRQGQHQSANTTTHHHAPPPMTTDRTKISSLANQTRRIHCSKRCWNCPCPQFPTGKRVKWFFCLDSISGQTYGLAYECDQRDLDRSSPKRRRGIAYNLLEARYMLRKHVQEIDKDCELNPAIRSVL